LDTCAGLPRHGGAGSGMQWKACPEPADHRQAAGNRRRAGSTPVRRRPTHPRPKSRLAQPVAGGKDNLRPAFHFIPPPASATNKGSG